MHTAATRPTHDKMLIIGAGPVGLAMARALRAHDIAYDQVEASEGIGGNWLNGVYESTHIISSKRTTEYPDFPMPDSFPDFPSAGQMLEYLGDYARHFELEDAIELGRRVAYIRPAEDDRYEVRFQREEVPRPYKGILLCNGHHWAESWPDLPGEFEGELIHSKQYRRPEQLRGKRVLVIGAGNSGCDIVSEAARVAASADLSVRDGVWLIPKTLFGRPVAELISPWVAPWLQRVILRVMLRISIGDITDYGLPRPRTALFERHPTISSEILHYIRHGRISVRGAIERYDGRHVVFADGTRREYDLIVAATGFRVAYPFLPDGLVPIEGATVPCYGGFLLPQYRHLYVCGWSQPRYGFGPLVTPAADLIARWIRLQDEIEPPLGLVLRRLGEKPATSNIMDPVATLRQIRRGRRAIPLLRFVGRRMRAGALPNPVWPPRPTEEAAC